MCSIYIDRMLCFAKWFLLATATSLVILQSLGQSEKINFNGFQEQQIASNPRELDSNRQGKLTINWEWQKKIGQIYFCAHLVLENYSPSIVTTSYDTETERILYIFGDTVLNAKRRARIKISLSNLLKGS